MDRWDQYCGAVVDWSTRSVTTPLPRIGRQSPGAGIERDQESGERSHPRAGTLDDPYSGPYVTSGDLPGQESRAPHSSSRSRLRNSLGRTPPTIGFLHLLDYQRASAASSGANGLPYREVPYRNPTSQRDPHRL